jgi:hypothetical protein
MKAALEPIVWVMRIHTDGDAVLGDPYVAAATVTRAGDDVIIQGFTSERYSVGIWRAAKMTLGEMGVKRAMWVRLTGGRRRAVVRDV